MLAVKQDAGDHRIDPYSEIRALLRRPQIADRAAAAKAAPCRILQIGRAFVMAVVVVLDDFETGFPVRRQISIGERIEVLERGNVDRSALAAPPPGAPAEN